MSDLLWLSVSLFVNLSRWLFLATKTFIVYRMILCQASSRKRCNTGKVAPDTDLDQLSLSHKSEAASIVSCMKQSLLRYVAIMKEQKHEPSVWNGDMHTVHYN